MRAQDFTLAGSGSADFSDIGNAPSEKFLDVLKTGMMRELFEEGRHSGSTNSLNFLRLRAAEETLVTGFFRWVRRGGKPEFVAVTRLRATLFEVNPDNVEVAPILTNNSVKINRMSDFSRISEIICENKTAPGKMQISLSSAMAIWRLSQISDASTKQDLDLREKIASMLGICSS